MSTAEEELQSEYQVKDGIQILDFYTAHREKQFLLVMGDQRFEINEGMAELIQLLKQNLPIETLAVEYGKLKGTSCEPNELSWIIDQFIRPHGILKSATIGDGPSNKISNYIYWKREFLMAEKIEPLIKKLSFLYNKEILRIFFPFLAILHIFFFAFWGEINFSMGTTPILVLLSIYGLYMFSFLLHEIGHATASYKYGAKFGNIGYGLYLYFPVLYADVTDVWKLTRLQRTIVDLGGIYFHMIINAILFALYLVFPSEFLSILISLITLAIVFNLNPFFRFDGYWIYSDLIGVPNLRQRSFEVLQYYFYKLRGKDVKIPYLFKIKTKEKVFFGIYTLVSNLFFIYVFYTIPQVFYDLLLAYPALLLDTVNQVVAAISVGDWINVVTVIKALLSPTIILGILIFFMYRMVKPVLETLYVKVLQSLKK